MKLWNVYILVLCLICSLSAFGDLTDDIEEDFGIEKPKSDDKKETETAVKDYEKKKKEKSQQTVDNPKKEIEKPKDDKKKQI